MSSPAGWTKCVRTQPHVEPKNHKTTKGLSSKCVHTEPHVEPKNHKTKKGLMRMIFSVSDTGILGKGNSEFSQQESNL